MLLQTTILEYMSFTKGYKFEKGTLKGIVWVILYKFWF